MSLPAPTDLAGDLATSAGAEVLTTVVGVLPVLVPVLVGFWALSFVWKRLMPGGAGQFIERRRNLRNHGI